MNPSIEDQLRWAESRAYALPIGALEARVARLEQAQWQLGPLNSALCTIEFDFTVTDSGTGSPISGATVDVLNSGGSIVATGTTDGSGECDLTVFGLDSYSFTVTASGYADAAASLSGSCGDVVAVPVAMTACAMSALCGGICLPTTLTAVESFFGASAPIIWNGSSWSGSVVISSPPHQLSCAAVATCRIFFVLQAPIGSTPTFFYRYASTPSGINNCPVAGAGPTSPSTIAAQNSTLSPSSCTPFHLTIPLTVNPVLSGQLMFPNGTSITVTIS